MKSIKFFLSAFVLLAVFSVGCKTMTRSQKGAVIGTAGGAAAGAVVGKVAGNTALGAIIGATVGGVTGAVIGRKMDKQAEELEKSVPGAKIERVGEGIVVEFSSQVLFALNQSALSANAKESLGKLVTILEKYPDTNIEVQGHTDNQGTTAYNQELSEQRAAAVIQYLQSKGVMLSRLTNKGFGELVPKYSNDTDAGQTQNRRVEFLISANEKMKAEAEKEAAAKSGR